MDKPEKMIDSAENIKAIDAGNMLDLVGQMPEMLEKGWAISDEINITRSDDIKNLVIAGMGGSAISGDIVAAILRDQAGFPVHVNRNYTCPKFVGKGTLFIAVSYSGNTEETLSAFKKALERGANIISICSGGELMDLSKKNDIPVIEVSTGLPPRAALGYLLSTLLNVLNKLGINKNLKTDLEEAVKLLKQLVRQYGPAQQLRENPVKMAAVRLFGKIPVIFAADGTTSAAGLRWKTQINENSKTTAVLAVFPELDHNDIVNFAALSPGQHNFSMVILRDEDDLGRMKRRIEITKSLISGFVGGTSEIWAQGKSLLAKILSLIIYGDFLSVYLGVISGIDPTPVEIIEKLKKELAR